MPRPRCWRPRLARGACGAPIRPAARRASGGDEAAEQNQRQQGERAHLPEPVEARADEERRDRRASAGDESAVGRVVADSACRAKRDPGAGQHQRDEEREPGPARFAERLERSAVRIADELPVAGRLVVDELIGTRSLAARGRRLERVERDPPLLDARAVAEIGHARGGRRLRALADGEAIPGTGTLGRRGHRTSSTAAATVAAVARRAARGARRSRSADALAARARRSPHP